MGKITVSLITTVLNEEKSIEEFLDALNQQTRIPDECIIVDAGSRDKTRQKIEAYKGAFPIVLITHPGNRSVGRNTAIKEAKYSIIACTDVGCIPEKGWLEELIKPFEKENVDVVSGFYHPKTFSVFEKCLATYTSVMEDKLDEKIYLPSSRSIAFTKRAWKGVGGYPEHLPTCEDLVFARDLKQKGYSFSLARNAIVQWPQRKNILEAFRQFFSYAVGDGTARYFRNQTPFLFARYIAGLFLIIMILYTDSQLLLLLTGVLILGYIIWAIQKNYRYVRRPQALYILPLLQFTSDIAVLSGTIIGVGKSLWVTPKT